MSTRIPIPVALWMTTFGVAVQSLGKLWFLERMVLLHDEGALRRCHVAGVG